MKTKRVLILVALLAVFAGYVGPADAAPAVEVWTVTQDGPSSAPPSLHFLKADTLQETGIANLGSGWAWHMAVANVGKNGDVWVTGNKQAQIINLDGTVKGMVDDAGFSYTEGIEKYNGKMLLMGNTSSGGQIVEYNLDGTVNRTLVSAPTYIPGLGGTGGNMAGNEGFGVGPDGKLYVAQTSYDQVIRFSKNGAFEAISSAFGGEVSDLVVINEGPRKGTALITDRQDNNVREFNLATLSVGPVFHNSTVGASPTQVIVEPGGNILIASTGSTVRRFDQAGNLLNESFMHAARTNFRAVAYIPEPASLALLSLGGLMILRRRR